MDQRPIHYDGSFHNAASEETIANEQFEITDEMRKNIGKNPYSLETNK